MAQHDDQVQTAVQAQFPDDAFSHQAIYNYWQTLRTKEWKLDQDPVVSAKMILEKASSQEESLGCVCVINMGDNPDYKCLAFSIPGVLKEWKERIKELVMDSSCKCIVKELKLRTDLYIKGNARWVTGSYLYYLVKHKGWEYHWDGASYDPG